MPLLTRFLFGWEGSFTKIDSRKKVPFDQLTFLVGRVPPTKIDNSTLFWNLSTGGPRYSRLPHVSIGDQGQLSSGPNWCQQVSAGT